MLRKKWQRILVEIQRLCAIRAALLNIQVNQDQKIKIESGDANDFIIILNKMIIRLVDKFQIGEICLIKIKNWFDHKWLNYSGKSVVQFHGGAGLIETSLNNEWREKITVPPFNPNRVLSELFFRNLKTDNKMFEKTLHTWKDSNDNVQNRISKYTKDGMFIWYSSDTEINQKGSLMVYIVQEDEIKTFYASFINKNGWKINRAKNASVSELESFLNDK